MLSRAVEFWQKKNTSRPLETVAIEWLQVDEIRPPKKGATCSV